MLKYLNTDIVFQEIPDETTLAINLTGCPCRCPGCHSTYLWADTGHPMDTEALEGLLSTVGRNITCVCFMGGDREPDAVSSLAQYLHSAHPHYKVAWYSGRQYIPRHVDKQQFDYIKVGPYIAHLGPLRSPRSNQRMMKRLADGSFVDITARFRAATGESPMTTTNC